MEENFRFHPAVLTAILYFGDPKPSMQVLADRLGISKQAVGKRIKLAEAFFLSFGQSQDNQEVLTLKEDNQRLQTIIATLRRQLIVSKTLIFLLGCLKERIAKFFPRFRLTRFDPREKKYILDMCGKFQAAGGTIKEFCKAIGKSSETICRWQHAYKKYGMAGLADKKTTPHHFANKIPSWLFQHLKLLYRRFPKWTPYQYYKFIAQNPAFQWHISIPTIKNIVDTFKKRSQDEIDRIKKRWSFGQGSAVWTIDFTTILKTGKYKLQLLTVSDQRSRFLFKSSLFLETSTERVMDHLEDLFIKYGKPFMIKADGGPEFRMTFRDDLEQLSVYLLTNPAYYGQFNGAHERIHRELKKYISRFFTHKNLTKIVDEITSFTEEHNHYWPYEILNDRTPAEIFFSDPDFVAKDVEVVKPYKKDGELRMKFTNREGKPARMSIPLFPNEESTG